MSTTDPLSAILLETAFGKQVPRKSIDGPQTGVVTKVTSTSCYFTIPRISTDFAYGPAPYLPGLNLAVGNEVLVVFVGDGVGTPWVVGGGSIPAPPTVPSPASTVVGPDSFGAPASAGTSTSYARSDHDHGLPAAPVSSVFGRAGAVASASGDYTAAQVTNAADKSSASTQTFTAEVDAPEVGASKTGTTGRYVGQTSGAPTYASPQAGDFANDPAHRCFWEYSGSAWVMVGGLNWIGSGPSNATPILYQSEFAYVSTDASGNFSLTFGTAFPTALLGVVATIGSTGSGDLAVQLSDTNGRDRLHFTGRIIHTTTGGGLVSSSSMAVNYMALGY